MKQKIGTVLDENTARRLKERSVQERRPMSEIITDALSNYMHGGRNAVLRLAAVERLCSRPFRLSNRQLVALNHEDYFDQ
ncbi:MAG: hypothetical protein ABSH28_13725 [Acidobacteriota bacterium]|jgi:hypothetical protein